ncbi:acetate--CoA ligase family protein [Actinomadura decatromicini]|uniref:acetate--CoA ligase family protein n=1 Tax=Actinomadura decatromicini TaxID=2604572 RepID=UPI0016530A00|nr:acetate--CoA ligase family protein [Actinomadura decatromicini]
MGQTNTAGTPTGTRTGIERLLAPSSIAMVGASNQEMRIGGQVYGNLALNFKGALYPVHPRDQAVQGDRAYRSVADLPGPVDLAVIAVPAGHVAGVIEQCGERGVGGAVVLTAGFAEAGPDGAALQRELADAAARTGVRVVGPNCIGYLSSAGGVAASFAMPPGTPLPPAGPVALVSQSGGFGSYIAEKAQLAGLRLGWFVSTGNEVDVNIAQVLRFLVERDETRVLLAFSETLRDPDVFVETARRAAELDKPLVLLKAGRSEEAARAALSHTASVVGSAEVFDAVCRQHGVVVADTMEEMLDLGMIFQDGRRPRGDRIGIMTTSGGAGVLLADGAGMAGLSVPEFPPGERDAIAAKMPQPFYGSASNPVDTTAQITAAPDLFQTVLGEVVGGSVVDMAATVTWARPGAANDAIIETYRSTDKPFAVLCTTWLEDFQKAGVPTFTDPRRVVHALAALARHTLRRPPATPEFVPDEDRARRVRSMLVEARNLGEDVLLESTAKRVMAEYGIPVTREIYVRGVRDSGPDEVAAAAAKLGGPVALKVMSYQLPHKSDVGGLRLGLSGADAVKDAYRDMLAEVARRAPDAMISGVLVQEMAPARLEIGCGMRHDPVFGPMVALGPGGIMIEMLAETALLRPPFDAAAAKEAIGGLLGGRLVGGSRGLSPGELDLLAATMTGLGALALEVPEIAEVDVNPVRVADGGAVAADALIVLADDAEES